MQEATQFKINLISHCREMKLFLRSLNMK